MVELGSDRGEVDDPGSFTFFQQGEEGLAHLMKRAKSLVISTDSGRIVRTGQRMID